MKLGVVIVCVNTLGMLAGMMAEDVEAGDSCEAFEMVSCGDARGRYRIMFCQPSTSGWKKIIRVQLDVRFNTRFCKRGDTELFGIAPKEKQIYVSDFCFGTFIVCVELEQEMIGSQNEEKGTDDANTTLTEDSTAHDSNAPIVSEDERKSNATADTSRSFNITEDDDISQTTDDGEAFFGDAGKITKYYPSFINTEDNSSETTPTADHNSPGHFVAEPSHAMDQTLKIILMAGIGTGGFVLVLLICVTAYMIHTCNRKRQKQSSQPDAFKSPKLSTSALVTAEHLNEVSVYDLIPCDKRKTHTVTSPTYGRRIQRSEKPDVPIVGTTPIKHEYFTLAPEVCKFCTPTLQKGGGGVSTYSHAQSEGVYDRLISVPRMSVSDSSTYNHLATFSRERKMTEDMSTQTDLSELE